MCALLGQDSAFCMLFWHRALQAHDAGGHGMLPLRSVKDVLAVLSYEVLGLTSAQILSLLLLAPADVDGQARPPPETLTARSYS